MNKLGKEAASSDLYEGKRIMLLKQKLNSTHLKLRTNLNLQETSGSNYWHRTNYQTVSYSNY